MYAVWEQGVEEDQKGMKWQESGENYIMRSFLICTLRQV
jgi:hypothetical protein